MVKDYTSRINKIEECMSYEFIINKGYWHIPGSSNFIACNGRYIINKDTIKLILKDIKDVYLFNKRSKKFKELDIDKIEEILEKFMYYILNENKIIINKNNIESYLDTIDNKDKNEVRATINWYTQIKNIDLSYDEEEIINKKNELYQNIDMETQELGEIKKQFEAMGNEIREKIEKIERMKQQYNNL